MKALLSAVLRTLLKLTAGLRESMRRIYAHAHLSSRIKTHLPTSVVVLGKVDVLGTGNISLGEQCFLFPGQYFETRGDAAITIGDHVVFSRGVHLVAMSGITIGKGTMIGEYTSVRDANHLRSEDKPMRDSGFEGRPIVLGDEVWIGRGVTILAGVTIGDGATVGANAVVTRDVPAGTIVAGVPAKPIQRR